MHTECSWPCSATQTISLIAHAIFLAGCSYAVRVERTAGSAAGTSPEEQNRAAEQTSGPVARETAPTVMPTEMFVPAPSATPLPVKNCGEESQALVGPQLVSLEEPSQMLLLQQDAEGKAKVSLTSVAHSKVTCLEVKFEREVAGVRETGAWSSLNVKEMSAGNKISVEVVLPNPGWHFGSLRAWSGGARAQALAVPKIGVGEIFLTSGQSNSANHGGTLQRPMHSDIFMWTADSTWVPAADPLPGATGDGGSPWIPMADALVESLRVPIGIVATGYGGTSVSQWQPSATLYPRIRSPLTRLKSAGIRAVLWHQGESDAMSGTSKEGYMTGMKNIIRETQADYGRLLPWFVARATVCQGTENAVIRDAQASLVDGLTVLAGPDTDKILGSNRLSDQCHFSDEGLKAHGKAWADAILQLLK